MGGRKLPAGSIEIDLHTEAFEKISSEPAFLLACYESPASQLLPKKNILNRRETGNEVELLVDYGHAATARFLW